MSTNHTGLVFGFLYLLGGIFFLVWARPRKRLADHPYCKVCGYDLFAQPEVPERCTECGAELRSGKGVVVGDIPWRKGRGLKGAWWLMLGVFWLGTTAYFQTPWRRFTPTSWLIKQSASRDVFTSMEAMQQLEERARQNSLSDAQWQSFTAAVTAYQSDAGPYWDAAVNNLVIRARVEKHLPDSVWQKYLEMLRTAAKTGPSVSGNFAQWDLQQCQAIP